MKEVNFLSSKYEIIRNNQNAFQIDEARDLITEHFEVYDYILGDYSYGKLRLKGFYDSTNKKRSNINDFSNIDEYILKFCSYRCKYFILKKIKNN